MSKKKNNHKIRKQARFRNGHGFHGIKSRREQRRKDKAAFIKHTDQSWVS